jgi:subtilisin-like proprotein convertase family protein
MILAYKVTSDANCEAASTSAVIEAIEDAVLRRDGDGYRLAAINISLGAGAFSGPCDADNLAYSQAVVAATEAGVPVIAAAGNAGYGSALNVPACLSDAIAVGSVWDTDPGLDGSSFCLDPECTTFCDDGNQWRTAVACYSNSGRQLDVLAPAEYLKAAASGAITIDFGGTSGAAAYAAGSAALLSQAFPGITPNEVSLLLRATGRPTMDDKNGLIRPIIDLAQAIDTVPVVAVAPDHGLPIAPEGGSPTVSEVVIESNGTVGSVRVLVDLEHPDPERLQLALEAPDGTRIVLLDPDASDPADLGDGFSPDGIVATFPDDIEPAESLGRLANIPISGVWTLSINDLRSTAAPGDARLMGWALAVEPPDSPGAATSMVIPVVAHTGGVADTAWRSDIRLFNPSRDHDALVRLFFVEGSTEDGAPSSRQTDVVVPHRSTVALDDIVLHRFAVDSGRGSLVVDDPSGCVARGTSRTYTVGDNGSFGQFVPPTVAGERSTGAGEPALVVLPTTGNDHRVNLGFTEIVGGSATVAVTVIDAVTGVAIGPSTFHAVDPHGNLQINGLLPHPERPEIADAYIVVTVVHGDGRITAYASVVDNRTGDAVFVRGATPMITSALTVPVVARTDGLSGTRWRSDLRLLNHGSFSVHIDAELRLQGAFGIPPLIESLELQPGESITIDDVVGDFFGVDDAVGSLRLVPQEGPAALCASSRTANHGSDGSYGQHVPAIQAGRGLERLGTVLHLSSSAVSRSNLGIVETAGDDVDLEIRLRDRKGHQIGTTRRTGLGPFESVQFNDIFSSLLAAPADNVRVEIQRIAGSGRWFAYGSVIDARSGDAIFVPVADAEDCSLTN